MKTFYVYLYLDPRRPGRFCYEDACLLYEPIYVGKGCNKRYLMHLKYLKNSNKHHNSHFLSKLRKITSKSLDPIVIIYRSFNSEVEAFACERVLVQQIGRFDLHLGPLCNQKDGGQGGANPSIEVRRKRTRHSEETKAKIRLACKGRVAWNKGKQHSDETKKKLSAARKQQGSPWRKGCLHSEETKRKLSVSHKGKRASEETRKKLSEAHKGKYFGAANPMFGRNHSEETKIKMRDAHKGKPSPLKGVPKTVETRAKMKASWLLRKQKKEEIKSHVKA